MNKFLFKRLIIPCVALTLLGGSRSSALTPVITDEDGKQMRRFELAEKNGDHSLDAAMISVLQQNPPANPDVIEAAAHALARLADTDALPAFDVAANNKDNFPNVINFVKVQAARLQAESRVQGMPDGSAKASAKVQTFLQVLNLTPQKINNDEAAYNEAQTYPTPPTPIGSQAMAELADMIYHGNYKDYTGLLLVQQVDFKQNSYTNLVMRLAALSGKDRIAAMVKDLAADKNLNADAELRLASDEGVAAGQEAVAQLGRMEQKRSSYTQANFHNLFMLIRYTQPPDTKAVRTWYSADPDTAVAEDAYTYLQP